VGMGFERGLTRKVLISMNIGSYNFSVKVVLLHHHDIYSPCISKCQEAEAPRATGCAISHNCAFLHLTKL
jgi:hypothetical protein